MTISSFNSVFHQVDLSLLKHFFAIATFGGFSKASRATGVSQSGLSLGLIKLEKCVGTPLIDRSKRPIELTPAGHSLLAVCQRFQGNFETMMSDAGSSGPTIQKRLRVGTALSVGFGPIAELCASIENHEEKFELELLEQNTYELLSAVHDGRMDAAFVPNDVFDKRLKFIPLLKDQIVFVVGRKHKGMFRTKNWKDVAARLPLITFPREAPMRALTDRICITEQVEFNTIYAINNIEALKLLLEQNRGGAFILKSLVAAELKAQRLFEEKLPIELPKSGIALALPQSEGRIPAVKHLLRLLDVGLQRGKH